MFAIDDSARAVQLLREWVVTAARSVATTTG